MFVFNLIKQNDRPLRLLAILMASGLFVLLAGLWFVQIAFAARFQDNLKRQSFRAVAIPPVRGMILDRNGVALAENRPRYSAVLYLEDLQRQFDDTFTSFANDYRRQRPELMKAGKKAPLKLMVRRELQWDAECAVVGGISSRVAGALGAPVLFDTNKFYRHSSEYPYVPYQILPDLDSRQVAIFAEQFSGQPSVELETQPVRYYPYGSLAAHLLGFVQRKDAEASFRYSLPNYEGRSGIEKMFEAELAGQTGVKSVLVNSQSYRQREEIDTPSEPGEDVYLTIDVAVQRAAEAGLAATGPNTRGAAVVMDVRNGDILAMASSPTYDPTEYITGTTPAEQARLSDPDFAPQLDRTVFGKFAPGSTFKIITSIACLEEGLNPNEEFESEGFYRVPGTKHVIGDTAGAGLFDFKKAFYKSSNTYFIHYGSKVGLRKILLVAKRFHLGEKTRIGLPERSGSVPYPDETALADLQHSLPDVCIGQEVTTTPLQIAGMVSVIANGGTLYWPRVVDKLRAPDSDIFEQVAAPGRVRDHVQIEPQHLSLIRQAMVLDTEAHNSDTDKGSAYDKFHDPHTGAPILGDFRVAGKTGSAEVKGGEHMPYKTTWFVSYGPYENPRYAVVVMVDHGSFGGISCAPVAVKIYQALIKMEQAAEHSAAHGMVAELK